MMYDGQSGLEMVVSAAAGKMYSESKNSIDKAAKVLKIAVIVLVTLAVLFMAIILCMFQCLTDLHGGNMEVFIDREGNQREYNKELITVEAFQTYIGLEEESYSHDSRKKEFEKNYRLNWELLWAVDLVADTGKSLAEDSFEALKPEFTYKQSMVKKEVAISRNGHEIREPAVTEKVLLPTTVDTYYKRLIYEYETGCFTTVTEADGNTITTTIQKEVLKEGYPMETENVSSRLLPYLNSIGIQGKSNLSFMVSVAREKHKNPNEGLDYVDKYISTIKK